MTETTGNESLESRLIGWKRISNYLGCSERTARRWEREEHLPVHRQQHDKRSTVFALPAELDTWLGTRADLPPTADPTGQASRSWAPAWIAVIVFAAVALVVLWPRTSTDDPPAERDPIAVDLYERGTALWEQRGEDANQRAVKLLTEAVERDDAYAEAWSALSLAWITLPTYSDEVSASDALEESLLAADRALQLDPTLVEARTAMASVARGRGDWLSSERIFLSALELDPDNTSLMLWFGGHARDAGFMNKSMQLTNEALAQDPTSPPILTEIAMNSYQLGEIETARSTLDYLWFDLGVETPVVWIGRWFALLDAGDHAAAGQWVDETPLRPFAETMRAYADFRAGTGADPATMAKVVTDAYNQGMPSWLAFHLLDQGGLTDAALDVLDDETSDGFFDLSVVLFFERGGEARQRAEFADFLERLGLFEYWQLRGAPDMCARDTNIVLCERLQARDAR
ncbi:MAG: hypothetical protein AAGA33_11290 [Pseudomonadota bacterium]